MLANLITAIGIATSIGMTQPQQPPLRSSVTSVEITYQYETNEVNSFNDLIVGNIYRTKPNNNDATFLRLTDFETIETIVYNISIDERYLDRESMPTITESYTDLIENDLENNGYFYSDDPTYFDYTINTGIKQSQGVTEQYVYIVYEYTYTNTQAIISADIIMTETIKNSLQDYIENTGDTFQEDNFFEKSNYLGNPTITETTTDGLYNTIESFIETYLYSNDKLKTTEYTIMGTTYNMAEWLAHTTTIILISLIIFVLVIFIKWLFKQIGNTFNLVGVLQ